MNEVITVAPTKWYANNRLSCTAKVQYCHAQSRVPLQNIEAGPFIVAVTVQLAYYTSYNNYFFF